MNQGRDIELSSIMGLLGIPYERAVYVKLHAACNAKKGKYVLFGGISNIKESPVQPNVVPFALWGMLYTIQDAEIPSNGLVHGNLWRCISERVAKVYVCRLPIAFELPA